MKNGRIIIQAGRKPWPHELRVASILALAGHNVEFLEELNIKTADIKLDGVTYEIKSPFTNKFDKIERNIKRGLKQSKNIIIDSSRMKSVDNNRVRDFLMKKSMEQKQIKKLILIDRKGKIVYIK